MDGVESEALGLALRRARCERGLTVQQVAATTRIPARNLEALERGDLHALPGRFYLRAEVLAYADAVGMKPGVALGLLQAATDPPAAADAATRETVAPLRRPVRLTALIAAVLLAAAAIVLLRPVRDAASTPQIDAAPPSLAVDAASSDPSSGTTGSAAGLDAPADIHATQPAAPAAEPELEITSEPDGARVTVDGIGWGVTPVTIKYQTPGAKQVRLTRDGFAAEERVIRVRPDQPRTSVHIELRAVD